MTVGALVLAAGSSRRLGADKRHAVMSNGASVLECTLGQIQGAGIPCRVCLPADDDETACCLAERGMDFYACKNSSMGMGATLAEGIAQVEDWTGVLVVLADMPWVTSDTYRLIARSVGEKTICAPVFDGQRGNPVGFGRDYFPQLGALSGDQGAKALLEEFSGQVVYLDVVDPGVLRDIDYPEDKV